MTILHNLKHFDLFGQPIQLCLNSNYTHKSVLGGFLTFILFGLFFAISIQGFIDLVSKSDIYSSTTLISNKEPPFIDLQPSIFNWAIALNPIIESPGVKEYFKYDIVQSQNYRDINGQYIKKKFIRELEPCTFDHFNNVYMLNSILKLTSNISLLFCPKKNDSYFVEGKFTSENFSFINIKISKCMNTTIKKICASNEEIDKYFKTNYDKIFFNMYFLNNIINVNNFDETVTSFLDDRINVLIDRKFYQEKNFYMISNEVYTDESIIRTIYEKELTTYTFENNFDEYSLDNAEKLSLNDTLYASLYIRSNLISKEYKRTFQKVGKYFGYIGGFWSLLFMGFGFIAKAYNQRRLIIKLSNSLYNFTLEETRNKKDNKDKNNGKIVKRKIELKTNKTFSKQFSDGNPFLNGIISYLNNSKGVILLKNLFFAFPNFLTILMRKNTKIKFRNQKKLYEKARITVLKDIDLLHILQKIKEIDKLTNVILNEDQKICFEFMPKQVISIGNNKHLEHSRSSLEYSRKINLQKNERILSKSKDYIKLYESVIKLKNQQVKIHNVEERIFKNFDNELMEIFNQEHLKEKNENFNKESHFKEQFFTKKIFN